MKFGARLRLAMLALAVALMGVFIAFATLHSRQQASELRARLSQVDFESFRIADQFRDFLRELNNTMFRYGTDHDPATLNEFLEASHQLDVWIDEQKPRLKTQREKEVLQQIDAAYDDYLRVARDLQTRLKFEGQKSATMDEFSPLRVESRRLFDLGQVLGKAHYESRNRLLAHANQSLTQFRWLTLGSLGLLFVFGIALAAVVYRDMIAPLRVKLVESQALVERHEKLASLGILRRYSCITDSKSGSIKSTRRSSYVADSGDNEWVSLLVFVI